MNSILTQEHIECYNEPLFPTKFTIYTKYEKQSYKSTCMKHVMIKKSIVIKNAVESEDSNCFYVPDSNEIEPEAFKQILSLLHVPKYALYNIKMKSEKNIQHMLSICKWFGFTSLYKKIMEKYLSLLKKSKRALNMFTQIDIVSNFLDIKQQNQNSVEIVRPVMFDFQNGYNPICGLITGDKLNDHELIDVSLSLFDFKPYFLGVYEPFREICKLLMDNLKCETTKEKFLLKLSVIDEKYKRFQPEKSRFTFSENYVRFEIDWSMFDEKKRAEFDERNDKAHPFPDPEPESESD